MRIDRRERTQPDAYLAVDNKLDPGVRSALDEKFYEDMIHRFKRETPEADKKAFVARYVAFLATGGKAEGDARSFCTQMATRLMLVARSGGDGTPADGQICRCLNGALKSEPSSLVNKSELETLARSRGLPCAPR